MGSLLSCPHPIVFLPKLFFLFIPNKLVELLTRAALTAGVHLVCLKDGSAVEELVFKSAETWRTSKLTLSLGLSHSELLNSDKFDTEPHCSLSCLLLTE